ncbi:MAG: CBS domain-containing protein [Gemmataceae bacterium]
MELARNLKVESVARLRPTAACCVQAERPVADAVVAMRRERVGCVLVCQGERLVGIFTERDLVRRVLADHLPLSLPLAGCMTADPVVVSLTESIGAAIRRMQQGGHRHLPVVDPEGRPVGVLSVKRIVHYLVEHFPSTIYCLPPDPNDFPAHREGA